jgi:hypothetical protein
VSASAGYIPPGTHPLSPAHHHHHQHHQNLILPALLQMDRPEESALFPELPCEAHITIARLGHSILDTFERLEVGSPVANERHCTAVLTHKPRTGNNGSTHSHTELDLRSQGRLLVVNSAYYITLTPLKFRTPLADGIRSESIPATDSSTSHHDPGFPPLSMYVGISWIRSGRRTTSSALSFF